MRESLFQYVWQHILFDPFNLKTGCGRHISIEFQGELNHGDGPDFKRARIRIDGLMMYGDIELHTETRLWYTHRHHEDPAYNSVILHIVADPDASSVTRQDGTPVPTLNLYDALSESVLSLLKRKHNDNRLPCEARITEIGHEVVERQFALARREYFDYRVNHLMQYYNRDLPPYQAWKQMTALALFEGMGYSNNREPMLQLGRKLFRLSPDHSYPDLSEQELYEHAGLTDETPDPDINWDYSSTRPANHPRQRIKQANALVKHFFDLPRSEYLNKSAQDLWNQLLQSCPQRPGKFRARQLQQVVWMPAVYLMGSLCGSSSLMEQSYHLWQQTNGGVPEPILATFTGCGLADKRQINHPGAIYQYKHYCRQHACTSCGIMKNIIGA